MNRVYKVIWSKAKHCYVVTSEIAKSVTKSASSARSAGRKGAAVLALTALLFTAGGVLGEAATANVTDVSGSSDARNLIIVTKDDGTSTNFSINNVAHATEADYANAATKATSDDNGEVIHNIYARKTDVEKNLSDLDKRINANTEAVIKVGQQAGENFTDLYAKVQTNADAVAAEAAARKTADQNNLKVGDDGVISKVSNDGTTPSAVKTLVLKVDGDNQITMDEKGIKVGLNSGVMDKDGFYAGGDDYEHAGAALKWDGSIKGADGKFTVDKDGNADIGGDLTVDKNLTVNGTFDSETLSSKLGENNYTTINGGKTQSMNLKVDAVGTETKVSSSTFDENGSRAWAKDDESIGKSSMTADEISQSLSDKGDNPENAASRVLSQNKENKYEIADVVSGKNGTIESTVNQTETGIKSTATDGKNTASTNLSNGGFNTYATDGTNKTYTKQTATDIKNTAKNGTISNTAKDLVNKATGDMTNTVGGKLLNDVTGDMENKVGGNLTTTVEKNMTTTVTGDSSLTAENINNEAKNRITNKALDVETDASSSIVNKVSNEYGSNTSTQLSYQTTEEMSQADGKTASYLRGAAEEKSQLTDGDKKTTIDTIAGQTNTNITEGTSTSNNLQKADQVASSVKNGDNQTVSNQNAESLASSATDGTNTTVANQNAKSFSSAATDGTNTSVVSQDAKSINSAVTDGTNSTGIRQDAQNIALSANNGTIAASAKNISNTASETLSNSAKNINNTATEKLSNSAADIENKASNSILNQVGENTFWKMTDGTVLESINGAGGQTNTITDTADSTVQNVKNGKNELTSTTSSTNADLTITNGSSAYTKVNTATGNKETVKEGENLASTNLTKDGFNVYAQDENGHNTIINNASGTTQTIQTDDKHLNVTTKTVGSSDEKLTSGRSVIDVLKSFDDEGNPAATSTVTDGTNTSEVKQTASEVATSAKDISNTAKEKLSNSAPEIENSATKSITDKVGDNVERAMTTEQIQDKVGKTTVTTTDGLTKLTDEDHNHTTEMDYANVTKDLSVERNTTLGKEGEDTNLTVNSKSEFKDTVKMDSTLEVDGESTFNNKVTITKGGLAVTGGTTTDTLNVTGETRTGTLHVKGNGYVDGDLNVEGNIETHDAELSADSRQVVTGRQLYQTNERVDKLDNRIKKVGANAAALAALRPGDFNPADKFSIAAGFGSYRNASAAALGLFYRPNENVLLSLGTSFGDGENMVNAGVSVKFGRGKSMAERRKEMAEEVSVMRDEMKSQNDRIAELEEMLKKQSELIEKLSKES